MNISSVAEAWAPLVAELNEWRRGGLCAQFWVRDDDAIALTPQLDRLTALARSVPTEIGLAVIPSRLTDPLGDYINSGTSPYYPMCHGWRHINYSGPSKPSEFGPDRPMRLMLEDAERALKTFSDRFARTPAVFVPPFSRISLRLIPELSRLGFNGVSVGPPLSERRFARIASRLGRAVAIFPASPARAGHYDVHVDPFDWRKASARSRESIARETVGYLRARRYGVVSHDRPIGLLLHHLAFDPETWNLCSEFFDTLAAHPAAAWPTVSSIVQSAAKTSGANQTPKGVELKHAAQA